MKENILNFKTGTTRDQKFIMNKPNSIEIGSVIKNLKINN